jgi:agmatine deiminase
VRAVLEGQNATPNPTPGALGYRMPAEWEQHTATWIAWPHNASDWPGRFQPIPWAYAEIVRQLAAVEQVHILVQNAEAEKRVRGVLKRAQVKTASVHFHPWPTNRVWTRDSGPIFVKREGSLAITNWKFNAWAKYPDWELDNALPGRVAGLLQLPAFTPEVTLADGTRHELVLEGGSIDTNGAGVLLTSEECLLSPVQQRNPGVSREQLEQAFREYLGIDQVLWMNLGIAGDDTHGHVDDITVVEANRADENHEPLAENLDRLRAARNRDGQPFRIVELPLPSPVVFEGQRLPASYANFYIANGLVLVPTFNDANDRHALNTLAEVFPRHRIVGIHCVDFIWGLGALHCMTQQQPAVQ